MKTYTTTLNDRTFGLTDENNLQFNYAYLCETEMRFCRGCGKLYARMTSHVLRSITVNYYYTTPSQSLCVLEEAVIHSQRLTCSSDI